MCPALASRSDWKGLEHLNDLCVVVVCCDLRNLCVVVVCCDLRTVGVHCRGHAQVFTCVQFSLESKTNGVLSGKHVERSDCL